MLPSCSIRSLEFNAAKITRNITGNTNVNTALAGLRQKRFCSPTSSLRNKPRVLIRSLVRGRRLRRDRLRRSRHAGWEGVGASESRLGDVEVDVLEGGAGHLEAGQLATPRERPAGQVVQQARGVGRGDRHRAVLV